MFVIICSKPTSYFKYTNVTIKNTEKNWRCKFQHSEVIIIKTRLLLTLIIALDEIRNRVARSFTFLIRAAASDRLSNCSSSPRARWSAAPCFVTMSPQVRTSVNFVPKIRSVESSSSFSGIPLIDIDPAPMPSSSSSSKNNRHESVKATT